MPPASPLAPDLERVASCDALWRLKLRDSFAYIAQVLEARGEPVGGRMAAAASRLAEGPVTPWVSCLYSYLVVEITRQDRRPVEWLIDDLVEASSLPVREERLMALGDPAVPSRWWDHFQRLMDTDRALPFKPIAPSDADAEACRAEFEAAMTLLARVDPAFHEEVRALLRVIVLGAPADADPSSHFGACSSFFLREGVLINAAQRRSPIRMLDMLIHEASHVLLFALATEQPLTTDRGETRLKSAARADLRPVDGIFHACFVATRVHLAMNRMIASGRLGPDDVREAAQRRDRNRDVAKPTLETLREHAAATPLGAEVLAGLDAYWAREEATEVAGAA
jgi:hypothetical protein